MKVTVVVSGLPKHVPIAELARKIDMIFDTNDVGTFRVRDIPTDTDRRLVGLDFEDGFDAMHVQLMLDGFEYRLENGREYTLKCKISNDPRHLRYHDEEYTDVDLEPNYGRNSKSLVSFNQSQIVRQNANLNAQLLLLKKKTMVVEAERKLLKAKKKLKKEYYEDDSVSSGEECDQCPKASKRRKSKSRERPTPRKDKIRSSVSKKSPSGAKKKSIKQTSRSKSRRSPSSSSTSTTSRSRSPVARKELSKPNRSQSRSRTSQLRSMRSQSRSKRSQSRSKRSKSQSRSKRSQSTSRRSLSRSRRSRSRSRRSHSRSRRSQCRSRRSQSRSRRSRCRAGRSQSRSRRSQSRSRGSELQIVKSLPKPGRYHSPRHTSKAYETRSHYYIDHPEIPTTSTSHFSEDYLESRRLKYILGNSPTPSRSRKSPLYYKDSPSGRSREIVTEIVNVRNYNENIYFGRNFTKENESLAREFALKVEDAVEMAVNEINNLVKDEKKLLSETDTNIVNNEFKNYINNEFKKIKTKLNQEMSVKEIVHFYRRGRRVDEDKEFILKLIRELVLVDTIINTNVTKVNVSEKNDFSSNRRRSIENQMWNEVEEVLQDIPMDILQDKENNTLENNGSSESENTAEQINTINININCKICRPAEIEIVPTLKADAVPKVDNTPKNNDNNVPKVDNTLVNNDKNKVIENNDCKLPNKPEEVENMPENNDNIKIWENMHENNGKNKIMENNYYNKQLKEPQVILETNITDGSDNKVPETKTMEDTTSKCEMLKNNESTKTEKIVSNTENKEQILNNSHNNESSLNKKGEDEHQNTNAAKKGELLLDPIAVTLEMLERNVPQNPLFVIPIKRIMRQMKSIIKKLSKDHEDLDNVAQIVLRERIVELLKGKTNFMKTAQIISLYRTNYPKDNDKAFLNEIIEKMNKGKAGELQK